MLACCSKLFYILTVFTHVSFLGVFLSLPGDLENFKKNPFVLKEGVEYRIKINFKVRESGLCRPQDSSVCCLRLLEAWRCYCSCSKLSLSWETVQRGCNACCLLQVNKDIVSGLKYVQQSFRKGVKGNSMFSFNPYIFLGGL